MRTRDCIIRKTIFNTCVKVKPLLNCFIIVLSDSGQTHGALSWTPTFYITINWHLRNYENRTIILGWLQWEKVQHLKEHQLSERWIAEDHQMADRQSNPYGRVEARYRYCLFLTQSKFEFSYSAFTKKHINAIGHSYIIVIGMKCASGVFYIY